MLTLLRWMKELQFQRAYREARRQAVGQSMHMGWAESDIRNARRAAFLSPGYREEVCGALLFQEQTATTLRFMPLDSRVKHMAIAFQGYSYWIE